MYKYFGLAFSLWFFLTPVSQALTLLPATVKLETADTLPQIFILRIHNEEKSPITVTPSVMDWGYDATQKKIFRAPGTLPFSMAPFISYDATPFVLAPQQGKVVQMQLKMPPNMLGGYHAMAFFHAVPVPPPGKPRAKVTLAMRLGATLLQETKGTTLIRSRIQDIQVQTGEDRQPSLQLSVTNEGNTYIQASARAALIGAGEKFLGSIQLPSKTLLRGQNHTLSGKWKEPLPPGKYRFMITYEYRNKRVTVLKGFQI